jgi:thioesterase domain-containing protein
LFDNGWSGYCERLDVVPIGGTHHSILEPPHLDRLRTGFLEAVEAA